MYETYTVAEEPTHWQYYVLLFVGYSIVTCVLMNTVANLVQRVSPDLRTLTPAQVWITVIPLFGSGWIFNVVYKLAEMLKEEFARRKMVEFETTPGLGAGMLFAFITFTAHLTLLIDEPVLTAVLYIASVILLVLYWIRLVNFREKIDRDSLTQYAQQQFSFQQPLQQQVPPPGYYPPNNYYPSQDVPPDAPPSNDEWDRWRPK